MFSWTYCNFSWCLTVLKKQASLEKFGASLKLFWQKINDLVELQEKILGDIHPALKNAMLEKEREVGVSKMGDDNIQKK